MISEVKHVLVGPKPLPLGAGNALGLAGGGDEFLMHRHASYARVLVRLAKGEKTRPLYSCQCKDT